MAIISMPPALPSAQDVVPMNSLHRRQLDLCRGVIVAQDCADGRRPSAPCLVPVVFVRDVTDDLIGYFMYAWHLFLTWVRFLDIPQTIHNGFSRWGSIKVQHRQRRVACWGNIYGANQSSAWTRSGREGMTVRFMGFSLTCEASRLWFFLRAQMCSSLFLTYQHHRSVTYL
jgi:hypothetical protein